MQKTLRIFKRYSHRRKGFALLFALITIFVLTVIILAFFSRAQLNRQISFTSTNQVRTNLLSRAAMDVIVGELREEILNGSASSNGGTASFPNVYQPNTTADLVLKREGVTSLTAAGSLLIADVSANGLGIYPGGRSLGSSSSVSNASLNGRSISNATWFDTYGPSLGTQGTLPTWVLVTRNNGIKVPAIANAKNPTNSDYVIGRFAYTVYDTGGLLNANVAGYPSVSATDAAYKSSQAHADLTQVGLSAADTSTLLGWRNANDIGSASTYSTYLQNYGEPSGFLSTEVGDNAFLSRRDLLNYIQNSASGIPVADATYFTHFSRSLNSPSWGPIADAVTLGGSNDPKAGETVPAIPHPYAYKTNANTTGAINRFFPNVRYGSAGTVTHYNDAGATSTYPVQAGDPLVQRRFSLAKLAWLGTSGPQGIITAPAIRACFGLVWDPTVPGWTYVGSTNPSNTLPLLAIPTLDLVAQETPPREPNFFELLQAGVLSGALGIDNQGYLKGVGTTTFPYLFQRSSFLQLLTLGANIIDQYKNDSYPTVVVGQWTNPATGASTNETVTGAKSLPFFDSYTDTAGKSADGNMADYLVFTLWNPSGSVSSTTGAVPNVRLHVHGGYSLDDPWTDNVTAIQPNFENTGHADATIQLNPASYSIFNTKTPLLTTALASSSLSTPWGSLPAGSSNLYPSPKLIGFEFPELTLDPSTAKDAQVYSYTSTEAAETVYSLRTALGTSDDPFVIEMEYQASNGNWIPYSYSTGINDNSTWRTGEDHETGNGSITPIAGGGTGVPGWTGAFPNLDPSPSPYGSGGGSDHDYKVDPRSTRFNEIQMDSSSEFISLALQSTSGSIAQLVPTLFATDSYFPGGAWAPMALAFNNQNPGSTAAGTQSTYTDLDSVLRFADYGMYTYTTGVPQFANYTAGTPYGNLNAGNYAAGTNFPIVLNRAFKSIGELGYAFTDTPWKSVDFFTKASAYGALLDLFSLNDEPAVVDDRSNMNTSQQLVTQSLLNGAAQNPDGSSPLSNPTALAAALMGYPSSSGAPTLVTDAQLAGFLQSIGVSDGLTGVKPAREAVIRALAGNTQTRTWNVLIDVVAQMGRYTPAATSLDNFLVEGEKRYWLSVAIDRYTGKIISQSMEPVNE